MTDRADTLRQQLIRNHDSQPLTRDTREPLYDSMGARLGTGTAALKLGASIDVVAPGKRSCPYHFHHAQEEMFIVLEGAGTLRVAGEMQAIRAGDVMFIPPGPDYPHQLINTSAAPLKYLSKVVEYPDSGKYLASATVGGNLHGFSRMHREKNDLDYWDGEP